MKFVYLSLTGNVRRFVKSMGVVDAVELNYSYPFTEVDEDYIVICPTYDDEITEIISDFIEYKNNRINLVGFVGSGNRNFDDGFCFNAKDLSDKYSVPLIHCIEFEGKEHDITKLNEEVYKIESARTTKEE